jgi:transposase InsO family protein
MSRAGNPYDNAVAESFMKTLKHEDITYGLTGQCPTRFHTSRTTWKICKIAGGYIHRTGRRLRRRTKPWLLGVTSPVSTGLTGGVTPEMYHIFARC